MKKTVAIIGSRAFDNYQIAEKCILSTIGISDIEKIVSGGAKGADSVGAEFATKNSIPLQVFKADWSVGMHAGILRNTTIIENADIVVAFWDLTSKGTADSLKKAIKKGKKVAVFTLDGLDVTTDATTLLTSLKKNQLNSTDMNILYIHGLESKLNPPKRSILEKYGQVFAPDIDYYSDRNAIRSILDQYAKVDINTIIGSSMGGFVGYYIADALDRPALLFNPALKYRPVEQIAPTFEGKLRSFKQIVIGQRDDIVNPADTLSFLAENLNRFTDYHISLRHEMWHRVEIPCFEEELEVFFGKICY